MDVALPSMESEEYNCAKCENTFTQRRALMKHMRSSHFRSDQEEEVVKEVQEEGAQVQVKRRTTHECAKCGETYRKLPTLMLHMREDHPDVDEEQDKEGFGKEDVVEDVSIEENMKDEEQKSEDVPTSTVSIKPPSMGDKVEEAITAAEEDDDMIQKLKQQVSEEYCEDDDDDDEDELIPDVSSQCGFCGIDMVLPTELKKHMALRHPEEVQEEELVEEEKKEDVMEEEKPVETEDVEEEVNTLAVVIDEVNMEATETVEEEKFNFDDFARDINGEDGIENAEDTVDTETITDDPDKTADEDMAEESEGLKTLKAMAEEVEKPHPTAATEESMLSSKPTVDNDEEQMADEEGKSNPSDEERVEVDTEEQPKPIAEDEAIAVEEDKSGPTSNLEILQQDESSNLDSENGKEPARKMTRKQLKRKVSEEQDKVVDVLESKTEQCDEEDVKDEVVESVEEEEMNIECTPDISELLFEDEAEDDAAEYLEEEAKAAALSVLEDLLSGLSYESPEEQARSVALSILEEVLYDVIEPSFVVESIIEELLSVVFDTEDGKEPARKMTRKQLKRKVYEELDEEVEEVVEVKVKKPRISVKPWGELSDIGFVCFECGVECKDKQHLRNHVLAHFYTKFDPFLPSSKPFACPECGSESRDRITLIRHFCWSHQKFEEATGVSMEQLEPRRVSKPEAGGSIGGRGRRSRRGEEPQLAGKRSRGLEEQQQGGKRSKRKAHISLQGEPIVSEQPEIILDDLSFEILEALKNIDEVQVKTSPKKRGRPRKASRPVEVVNIDDEENEAPKWKIGLGKTTVAPVDFNVSKRARRKSPPAPPKVDTSRILSSLPKSTKIMFTPGREAIRPGEKRPLAPAAPPAAPAAKKLLCSLCKKIFLTRLSFESHVKSDHGKGRELQSPGTRKVQVAESKKMDFKKEVVEPQKVLMVGSKEVKVMEMKTVAVPTDKCGICKQNISKSDMIKHMKSHQINCQNCSFNCTSSKALEVHRKSHHTFKCKCKMVLATKELLDAHTKLVHMFNCQKCGNSFDQKPLLENHIKTTHYFKCNTCGKVLETKASLEVHDKAEHSSCSVCEDEFSWAEPNHSCYYTKNNIKPVIESSCSW